MGSDVCQINNLGKLIQNMEILLVDMGGTLDYKKTVIDKLNLQKYHRIKFYYYCDNLDGNTIRLYDSTFHNEFNHLYIEPKDFVIVRGKNLGTPDGTLKWNIRNLFESHEKPPKKTNTNHPDKCLLYFEEKNRGANKLKDRYEALKGKVHDRKTSFMTFVKKLETTTTWLDSPASTRFHLNKKQGLLEHSINVAEALLRFRDFLAPEISEESCVIVGLFHDVGKVGMPGKPLYLKNDNHWEVEKCNITYKINSEVVQMNIAARSLYLISKYVPLSDAEVQAILYHDGQYIEGNRTVAHREEHLTLLAHWADYWTAHIHEERRELRS